MLTSGYCLEYCRKQDINQSNPGITCYRKVPQTMYLIALIFFTQFWPSLTVIATGFIPCPSSSSAGLSEHVWLHSATVQAWSAKVQICLKSCL